MEKSKHMSFEDYSKKISETIRRMNLIAITGVSGIGKSTFVQLLVKNSTFPISVICADDFLKRSYCGTNGFRNNTKEILCPEMFNWGLLNGVINSLRAGQLVIIPHYSHGYGWTDTNTIFPADIIIVDGLFLDSECCNSIIDFDLIITMECSKELLYQLRMKRDNYHRQNADSFSRTVEETEAEIENCILSNESYKRTASSNNVKRILIDDNLFINELS